CPPENRTRAASGSSELTMGSASCHHSVVAPAQAGAHIPEIAECGTVRPRVRGGDIRGNYARWSLRCFSSLLSRLVGELARERRELAAFAVAAILEVDPVVGIDVLGRDVVALLQKAHQDEPSLHLLARRGPGDIGIVADEFHTDRIGLDHAAIG